VSPRIATIGVAAPIVADLGVGGPVGVGSGREPTYPTVPIVWPPMPAEPARPVHIAFLPDGSGSVTAHHGNDPLGRRFEEIGLAMERVGRTWRRHLRGAKQPTASVHHFSPGPCDVAATPLTARGRAVLDRGLVVPPGGTHSMLGPSLSAAEALAVARPEASTVVVACSDFQLFDTDVDDVLDRFASFPGVPVAIGLGAPVPDRLVNDHRVLVAAVQWDSPPGVVAVAVAEAIAVGAR
jgi:hypothetical protein